MLVAGMLLISLVGVALMAPLPYVIEGPGVTEDALSTHDGRPVIEIAGATTYETSGEIEVTTVSVSSPTYRPRLAEVINAWFSDEEVVLPRDTVYPPEQTVEEVEEQNRTDMIGSQEAAIAAGLEQAGVEPFVVRVGAVTTDAPADGTLQVDDLIRSVDDTTVGSAEELVEAIRAVEPGDSVSLAIERDGKTLDVDVTTEPTPDEPDVPRIGIAPANDAVFDPPFDVDIQLDQDIGGPSAGLVFSVAVYDLLTPGPLLDGRHVAGTGTIDVDGQVGPIGGIQQKIVGAYDDGEGAELFLVPAANCEAAADSALADDVMLVEVATLDDAVMALEQVAAGDADDVGRC